MVIRASTKLEHEWSIPAWDRIWFNRFFSGLPKFSRNLSKEHVIPSYRLATLDTNQKEIEKVFFGKIFCQSFEEEHATQCRYTTTR